MNCLQLFLSISTRTATTGVAHALDPWVRFMIVNAMDYSFLYVSQLALLVMYNPSTTFNQSFPFHATTLDADGPSTSRKMVIQNNGAQALDSVKESGESEAIVGVKGGGGGGSFGNTVGRCRLKLVEPMSKLVEPMLELVEIHVGTRRNPC